MTERGLNFVHENILRKEITLRMLKREKVSGKLRAHTDYLPLTALYSVTQLSTRLSHGFLLEVKFARSGQWSVVNGQWSVLIHVYYAPTDLCNHFEGRRFRG